MLLKLSRSRELIAYETWFAFTHPNRMKEPYMDKLRELADAAGVDPSDRVRWNAWRGGT